MSVSIAQWSTVFVIGQWACPTAGDRLLLQQTPSIRFCFLRLQLGFIVGFQVDIRKKEVNEVVYFLIILFFNEFRHTNGISS